jgi:hypothetical protein
MMNMPPINILNQRLPNKSMLTAIEYIKGRQWVGKTKRTLALFLCQCGQKKVLPVTKILNGHQISCGCMHKNHRVPNKKYNSYSEKLRKIYYSMINRCHSEKDTAYKYYGKRGVTVCKEWREDGQKFFDWAIKNGWKTGLELDKDKLGNGLLYSPETCCFLTKRENMNETRRIRRYKFRGKLRTVLEISAITNIDAERIRSRIETLGWPIEKAATQHYGKQSPRH